MRNVIRLVGLLVLAFLVCLPLAALGAVDAPQEVDASTPLLAALQAIAAILGAIAAIATVLAPIFPSFKNLDSKLRPAVERVGALIRTAEGLRLSVPFTRIVFKGKPPVPPAVLLLVLLVPSVSLADWQPLSGAVAGRILSSAGSSLSDGDRWAKGDRPCWDGHYLVWSSDRADVTMLPTIAHPRWPECSTGVVVASTRPVKPRAAVVWMDSPNHFGVSHRGSLLVADNTHSAPTNAEAHPVVPVAADTKARPAGPEDQPLAVTPSEVQRAAAIVAALAAAGQAGLTTAQAGVQAAPILKSWAETQAGQIVMGCIAGAIVLTSAAGAAAGVIVSLQ